MAKLGDQVQVKVSDRGVEGGKRRLSIEVEAGEDFFYLTNALSREGSIKDVSTQLRVVVRSGLVSYVQDCRELLRKLCREGMPGKEVKKVGQDKTKQ